MNPQMMMMLKQLMQRLGIDPSQMGGMGRPGMGMGMGRRPPPPGMQRNPDFRSQMQGWMAQRPDRFLQAPAAPPAPQAPTMASAATAAPTPPAPMPKPNFGQQMSQWAHSKPARPEGFSGAWGQSPQMDSWRGARPSKPMKPMGM